MGHKSSFALDQLAVNGTSLQVYHRYKTGGKGLSKEESTRRLLQYETNILPHTASVNIAVVFLKQIGNVLVALLLVGMAIAWYLGDTSQAIAIAVVVVLNALIGTVQEYKAEQALQAFKKLLPTMARVRRDGSVQVISATRLTIGDVVLLSAGDRVPADIRLTRSAALEINQSTLTGETQPHEKHSSPLKTADVPLIELDNIAFSSTYVVKGEGEGVVIAIGAQTVIGTIAQETTTIRAPKTLLEQEIERVGVITIYLALVVGGVIALASIVEQRPFTEVFFTIVSLSVAVVPEGLPAAVSVTLGLGALRMLRKKTIAKHLHAVETLGSVTVICTDKTGTLTQNELSVHHEQLASDNHEDMQTWRNIIAGLCHDMQTTPTGLVGDALDKAILLSVPRKDRTHLEKTYTRLAELPFDARRKRMSVIVQSADNRIFCVTKGATHAIKKCLSNPHTMEKLDDVITDWAGHGEKVVALAFREIKASEWKKYSEHPENFENSIEADLHLVSVIGLVDPPRVNVAASIAESRTAGIKTVMVTGDWAPTAISIGKTIGLYTTDPEVITGRALASLTSHELISRIRHNKSLNILFAEIDPRQKQKIVTALQATHATVAMTGDGVNDAPALKQASVGVAMGLAGTDVAREAADIVLQNDSYQSIVDSVREGRTIYNNIKKFVFYEFASNAAEVLVVVLAVLLNLPAPLLPIHIIIIDLVIGLLPSFALGVEPVNPKVMHEPPRNASDSLLNKHVLLRIVMCGTLVAIGALISFVVTLQRGEWVWGDAVRLEDPTLTYAITTVFATVSLCQIGLVFHARSNKRTLFELASIHNKRLIQAASLSFIILLAFIYVPYSNALLHTAPLALSDWLIPVCTLGLVICVEDLRKRYARMRYNQALALAQS